MDLTVEQKNAITDICADVEWNVCLAPHTTFKVGGSAHGLVRVQNENELVALLQFCADHSVLYRVLGRGSNLIVSDDGFAGIIIVLEGEFSQIEVSQEIGFSLSLQVGGGVSLTRLCRFTVKYGYAGAEFLLGIPGTVGGAVLMNAGAWGEEICNMITAVTLITKDGAQYLSRGEIPYSYRAWENFNETYPGAIITEMQIMLHKASPDQVSEECRLITEKRRAAQGIKEPNAGSFFKNPNATSKLTGITETSAGQLIDSCGLKGKRIGDVMVSTQHANFFVNCGKATAQDINQLMSLVQQQVKKETGILLEPEVHFM